MKKPHKENIKTHFQNIELSPEQLDSLGKLQAKSNRRQDNSPWIKLPLAVAASFLLVIGLYWFNSSSLANKIVAEVAYNHIKDMPMEIKTTSFEKVQNHLAKIDFTLTNSKRLQADKWKLLGGRYCSIQGHLAAQLKLQKVETQEIFTLYQVSLPDAKIFSSQFPLVAYDTGVRVELWSEKGLLFGLAGK